jgi:hypothetical protein
MRATPSTGWAATMRASRQHLDRVWPDTDPGPNSPSSRCRYVVAEVDAHACCPTSADGHGFYTSPMADLAVVEDRIWALLDRYRDELEEATIYGMPSLRWPGSGGHDYFAAVKRSAQKVSVYAIAVDLWPEALEGSSEEFTKRRTGKATFSFPSLDDELAAELEAFLARLYQPYREHHAGPSSTY